MEDLIEHRLTAAIALSSLDIRTGAATGLPQAVRDAIRLFRATGITYSMIGGLAVSVYSRPRSTEDADFMVPFGSEQAIAQKAPEYNFGEPELGMYGYSIRHSSGVTVDILEATLPYEEEAVSQATQTKVYGLPVNVTGAAHLILTKLRADRFEDQNDIVQILKGMTPVQIWDVKNMVANHMPEKVEDFDQLIAIADHEKGQNK